MSTSIKQFYQGTTKDFIIFIDDDSQIEAYKKDSTIPLSQIVANFQVYIPESGRGVEGVLLEASKLDLENEFGDKPVEDIVEKIVKEGELKRGGKLNKKGTSSKNDANGSFA